MWKPLREFFQDEDGLTTVEYALLLALIVVSAMTAWQGLDVSVSNAAERAADSMVARN